MINKYHCISLLICTIATIIQPLVAAAVDVRLYGVTDSTSNSLLVRISSTDGSSTVIGSTALSITAIAWHPLETALWAAAHGNLYSLNTATAAATKRLILQPFVSIDGAFDFVVQLAFTSDGQLYALTIPGDQATQPWQWLSPVICKIDMATGACSSVAVPSDDILNALGAGFSFDGRDNLWIRSQSNLFTVADTTTATTTAVAPTPYPNADNGGLEWIWGMSFAGNDVCYVLQGSPTETSLTSTRLSVMDTTTGALASVGLVGRVLRDFAVETLGVYLAYPSAATQGVHRDIVVYATPAFHTPITIYLNASSNADVLATSSIAVSSVDVSSELLSFLSNIQGVSKLTLTAVDSRGRRVTNTMPLAVLPPPKLQTPPTNVLALVGVNGTLAISDMQKLSGVTLTATASGSAHVWTDSVGVHWNVATASSQTITVTASNVYGGTNTVQFQLNAVNAAPCLQL